MPCPHLVFSDRPSHPNGIYLCECPHREQVPYAPSLTELRSRCLTKRKHKDCWQGKAPPKTPAYWETHRI